MSSQDEGIRLCGAGRKSAGPRLAGLAASTQRCENRLLDVRTVSRVVQPARGGLPVSLSGPSALHEGAVSLIETCFLCVLKSLEGVIVS